MLRTASILAALVLALAGSGCGGDLPPAAVDAGVDGARVEAGRPDVGVDAGMDAGPPPPRRFITDTQGRALILHGINDGTAKDDPLFSPSFDEADVQRMTETWGFDFDRYLVFWEAAEPMPGMIDQAYFDRIEQRLDWAAAHGMLVMLDMHQDVYARRFCCDGAPAWAIRDDGLPFELQSVWSLNYLQPAVERAFDHFFSYDAADRDLQDHYGDVWVALATRFRDHPALLGFDLMNEPSGGSAIDLAEITRGVAAGPTSVTSVFDQTLLIPFYQRLIDRIRAVDPDHWIFFEPRFGAAGSGAVQYFAPLTDPRPGESRVVYAPHLYSFNYEASSSYAPSDRTVARWEAARIEESRAQNFPILMGEFGMDRTFPGAAQYLDDVLEMADRQMISWSYWAYSPGTWGFWDPIAMTEQSNIDQLVRVYPQRVAGTPTAWSWDRTTRVFTLAFDTRAGVTGPTEIFVPAERFFPGGFDVTSTDPSGTWTQSFDAGRRVLSLTTSETVASHAFTLRAR